jgi:hypothetical protein
MGHYDSNRQFDEECRIHGLYKGTDDKWEPILRPPLPVSPPCGPDTVYLRIEYLTPQTFNRWTDGTKWICDTICSDVERPESVGLISAELSSVKEFISTYPHSVGTFYLIVSKIRDAVEIIEANPKRDIRVLLIPKPDDAS